MHMVIPYTATSHPNQKTNRGPLRARRVKSYTKYNNFCHFRLSLRRFTTVMTEPKVFFFTKEAETPEKIIQMNMDICNDKDKLRNWVIMCLTKIWISHSPAYRSPGKPLHRKSRLWLQQKFLIILVTKNISYNQELMRFTKNKNKKRDAIPGMPRSTVT